MPSSSVLQLVVFDCDGTLVDSQHSIIDSMSAAFEAHTHVIPQAESIRRVVGLPLRHAIGQLLPQLEDEEHGRVENSYIEAFHELRQQGKVADPLYPGALETIKQLADAGFMLGIATGKGSRGLLAPLETHGITDRFNTLQTADTAPGKPSPGMLLNAMNETGTEPKNTAMIGDTTFDIEMAVSAGTLAVGVSWGYHPLEHLKSVGANAVIEEFAELPDRLQALGMAL